MPTVPSTCPFKTKVLIALRAPHAPARTRTSAHTNVHRQRQRTRTRARSQTHARARTKTLVTVTRALAQKPIRRSKTEATLFYIPSCVCLGRRWEPLWPTLGKAATPHPRQRAKAGPPGSSLCLCSSLAVVKRERESERRGTRDIGGRSVEGTDNEVQSSTSEAVVSQTAHTHERTHAHTHTHTHTPLQGEKGGREKRRARPRGSLGPPLPAWMATGPCGCGGWVYPIKRAL